MRAPGQRRRFAAGLLLALVPLAAGAAAPHANEPLLAALRACDADARDLLLRLVSIDSGTGDVDGLAQVAAIYARELKALGAEVQLVPSTPPGQGDNLVASLSGRGKGRVLLMAHMDTVFARGDAAKRPPHWDGDHLIGPGAGDDKSGGVIAICALRALQRIGYTDFARIEVMLNASEEIGSPGSRDLIRSLAQRSDLAINLERGVPADKVVVARKGAAVLSFEITGRAAHSGLEPELGRNAVLEAAHLALAVDHLGDPAQRTTVTVDMLHGGERTNIVPAHAELKADVRSFSRAEFDRVEHAAAELAAHPSIDGVSIESSLVRDFPPWPRSAATEALVARASRLYAEINRTLVPIEVGSSADSSLAAEVGTPTLDGFGIEGGGAHTPADYADLSTLVPRGYLLARLLMEVGHDPALR